MALSAFARRLLAWYDRDRRDLPWRGQTDPYRIWISEAMLQQTVVATVIPYYNRFLQRFATVADLAAAPEADVMHAWSGLGYYSRARSLKRAAEAIVSDHDGKLPDQEEVLRTLPGVGPYTAAAVAAIAFGRRAFALDGNAARVMARVKAYEGELEAPTTKRDLHAFGLDLVPMERSGDFAQAVMELGARVCVPRAPACGVCPVAGSCEAFAQGRAQELPRRRPRRPKKPLSLVFVAIKNGEEVLLERRPSPGLLGGTWCLPAAEVGAGQSLEDSARSLMRQRKLGKGTALYIVPGSVRHIFTHLDVQAQVVSLRHAGGVPDARGPGMSTAPPLRWVNARQPEGVALASFARKLLAHVVDAEVPPPKV